MVPNQLDARPFAGGMLLNWGVSKGSQAPLSERHATPNADRQSAWPTPPTQARLPRKLPPDSYMGHPNA
jgi:hypothetical protein